MTLAEVLLDSEHEVLARVKANLQLFLRVCVF